VCGSLHWLCLGRRSRDACVVLAEIKVLFFTPEQEKDRSQFVDAATGTELEVADKVSLVEWFANHYRDFGATLEFVTNRCDGCQVASPPTPVFYPCCGTFSGSQVDRGLTVLQGLWWHWRDSAVEG
jgi:hypothetical protein